MNWFVEALFRPSGNRHYTTKKSHKRRLTAEILISVLIFGLIGFLAKNWIGLLLGSALAVIFTLVIDFYYDKIAWPIYESLGFKKHTSNQTQEELLASAKKEVVKNKN